MKQGGMLRRDRDATPGCVIVAAVALVASTTLALAVVIIDTVKHFS